MTKVALTQLMSKASQLHHCTFGTGSTHDEITAHETAEDDTRTGHKARLIKPTWKTCLNTSAGMY